MSKTTVFRKVRAAGALPLALAMLGCGSTESQATDSGDVQAVDQPLYGLGSLAPKWPNGIVPVCFVDTVNNAALRAQIPTLLGLSWSNYGDITFTGFGACSGGDEVQVNFVPSSDPKSNGLTVGGMGAGTRPVYLISDDSSPNQTHFQYEVLHEFGHALGFAHEMQRPDNWVGGVALQCGALGSNPANQFTPRSGGLNLTATFDPNSIMNYCDPSGQNTIALSTGDQTGVASWDAYGPAWLSVVPNIITVVAGQGPVQIQLLPGRQTGNATVTGLPNNVLALPDTPSGILESIEALENAAPGTYVATAHLYTYDANNQLVDHTGPLQITVLPCPQLPNTCGAAGGPQCGSVSLGCGLTASCGGCPAGQICTANQCVPNPVCIPKTCTFETGMCGVQADGCGGTLSCGGCSAGEACDPTGYCKCTTAECKCVGAGDTWNGTRCVTRVCQTAACKCSANGGYWNGHLCQ